MNRTSKLILSAAMLLNLSGAMAAPTFVGTRDDFRDETIYFAITTRFYDGDPSNNAQCWDNQDANRDDPPWRGDFKGLIEKLDYIKSLGFTAVWITPVVANASGYDYHGYHAYDISRVDPRYESSDTNLQTLIDALHARGMKLIIDIVLNHTGNFGEANLCKLFERDYTADQSDIDACMKPLTKSMGGRLPDNYASMAGGQQYAARLAEMKNTDGVNHDTRNFWHHYGNFNWDDDTRWWAQIAGDCVDLNTENQAVADYLVESYGKLIAMGCDGFRIDTSGHISRLTFNKMFIPRFNELAEKYKAKRSGGPFFMFGEVCARDRNVSYRGQDRLSPYFYTWKESKIYAWDSDPRSWDNIVVKEGQKGSHTNVASVDSHAADYKATGGVAKSNNALLDGNSYHKPDHSKYSGFSVIDFPMHWNFENATSAFGVRYGDNLYNDATYNVTYVDSHDYAPDCAPEGQRFAKGQDVWAENLDLMFTFRGIPCLFYGSEIEFRKGSPIDVGTNAPLKDTGRAYFGGYITGDVDCTDFGQYSNATGNMATTLSHPLAAHIRRLNLIRAAVPALRKGQYSTNGVSGTLAFKRRYTDDKTDSYCLVTISGNATFSSIENGTYTDVITGDVQEVKSNSLSVKCSGKGNMRVYVLSTSKTPAPGKIGADGKYLYGTASTGGNGGGYDGNEEDGSENNGGGNGGNGGGQETVIEPALGFGEQAVFFENSDGWGGKMKCYSWNGDKQYFGGWPGSSMDYLGNNVWKYRYDGSETIAEGVAGVIFNNGSKQTSDLIWRNGGYYNASGYVKTIAPSALDGAGEYESDAVEAVSGGLRLRLAHDAGLAVYTVDGRLVRNTVLTAGEHSVALPSGYYIAKLGERAMRVAVR